jgi:Mrp family chromosome partitioning ATPase
LSTLAGLALGLGFAFVTEVMSTGSQSYASPVEATRHHALNSDTSASVDIPDFKFPAFVPPQPAPAAANIFANSPEPSTSVFGMMPAALTASAASVMIIELQHNRAPKLGGAAQRVAATLVGLNASYGHSSFTFTSIGSNGPNAALAAIATARTLAAEGHKTIIIDVSPSNTGFEHMLSLQPGVGVAELVTGDADFTKVVARDPASTLHVIRYGNTATLQSNGLIAQRLETILKALRSIYGFIVLHAGEANANTVQIVNVSDVVVVVTTQARLKDAADSARTIEANGKTKTLLLKLDYQNASQPAQAVAS